MNSADTTETATIRSPFGLLGLFAVHFARTRYFGVRRSRNPAAPAPRSQRSSTSTACPLLALIHGARPLDGMHSAIRAMQLNDRYRGGWTFGEREWVKEPGSNKRVPRTRRSGPLVTQERPELALADECTWAAVQQRFASRPTTPKAHRSYMLSSLMHCALCGGRMQNTGGSTTRRYFGCANAQKRGGSVCTNRRNIPMAPLEDAVLGTITAKLGACMGECVSWWMSGSRPGRPGLTAAKSNSGSR